MMKVPVSGRSAGQSLPRREDARLVTGRGCYTDDINFEGQAYLFVVRSPYAHARIVRIDTEKARTQPGVLGVLTARDAAADGICGIPHKAVPSNPYEVPLRSRDGSPFFIAPHPVLAEDRVRFVGEPVAAVIAESPARAEDAAELVDIAYEPLPAVTSAIAALEPDAPLVWEENGTNLCVDSVAGDCEATDLAFARAAHVVALDTWIHRVTGAPLEPRAAIGLYDAQSGRYTVHVGAGGGVARQRDMLCGALGVADTAVRIVSPDIGGNFGTRNPTYPEVVLVAWAARRLGRPIKWTASRREAFLGDYHGRDLASRAELALDSEGRFLALRGVNTSNIGAHAITFVPLAKGIAVSPSVYDIPVACMRGRAVLTHTSPTTAYRSAGRPEVMFVLERLIDIAARRHGFDRVELRRKNLVRPDAMPHRNPLGLVYDSGDYPAILDRALELAEWSTFESRRAAARTRGRYRGIGVGLSIELNTGLPRERAHITVDPSGTIELVLGTMSAGQGHETSFAQIVSDWFGVDLDQVRLVTGDSDRVVVGGGSGSARSIRVGAVVIAKAAEQVLAIGKGIAARLLGVEERDIEFADQFFRAKDSQRAVGLFEVAAAARREAALAGGLVGLADENMAEPSFAYSCAVCEVEVDPETGLVEVISYASVDDVGRAINPMLIHGQSHGGIAQGVGQALWECLRYDPESGQLLSATFMDYAMPRADVLPSFKIALSEVPSTSNPLGLRGGSEGGITPALGVVVNAIVDALADLGVEHIEMPATPERVWEAIRTAQATAGGQRHSPG